MLRQLGRAAAAWLLLGAAGCGSRPDEGGSGPAIIRVTMDEYRFSYARPVPAGRVVFEVRNEGRLRHQFILTPIPDEVPPIGEQLSSSNRRTTVPLALVPTRRPGQVGTFAVDLLPGRYAVLCFVKDGGDTPHALRGMSSEFGVKAPSAPAPIQGQPEASMFGDGTGADRLLRRR